MCASHLFLNVYSSTETLTELRQARLKKKKKPKNKKTYIFPCCNFLMPECISFFQNQCQVQPIVWLLFIWLLFIFVQTNDKQIAL